LVEEQELALVTKKMQVNPPNTAVEKNLTQQPSVETIHPIEEEDEKRT
jgi:hypothetical protein